MAETLTPADRELMEAVIAAVGVREPVQAMVPSGDPAVDGWGGSIAEHGFTPAEIEGWALPEGDDEGWPFYVGREHGRWTGGSWNGGNYGVRMDPGPSTEAPVTEVATWLSEQLYGGGLFSHG